MEQAKFSMPLLGDVFPEIEVQTTHGRMKIPADLKGSWFVLFSHPADYTPVCTTEFVAFQNRFDEFKKLNCKLKVIKPILEKSEQERFELTEDTVSQRDENLGRDGRRYEVCVFKWMWTNPV